MESGNRSDRGHSNERNERRPNSVDRNRDQTSRSRDREYDKRDKDPETFTQVYVAKLDRRTRESDLKEAFLKFGKIKDIIVKHSYAFINYEDHEAATNAVKDMNGVTFVNGEQLSVE